MDNLLVPAPLRETLGDAGSDGLVTMFADAHQFAVASFERTLNRRLADMSSSFDRRLTDETSKIRVEMALMKFDILKWNFLFWVGQLAAMTAILSVMLRGLR